MMFSRWLKRVRGEKPSGATEPVQERVHHEKAAHSQDRRANAVHARDRNENATRSQERNEGYASHAGTVVRDRADHSVSRDSIDPDAITVLYRLSRAGHVAYLVGGGVRDLLLGRKPKDFDIGTDAHPQQIKKLFRNCFLVGRRFRLAHIRFGTKVIETSTFRRQPDTVSVDAPPSEDIMHHRDNTFGTPVEDARRRDFTVNGLFYDIRTFKVIDHVGGLADLERKVIRCIGDPGLRFREDPVRMLRAVRFAARLGFTIEREAWGAILRHHAEIQKAAAPRVLEEISRLFAFRSAEKAFRLLRESRMLVDMFPEIEAYFVGGGDVEEYCRFFSELDRRDGATDDPPPMALLFGVLMYPVFEARVRAIEGAGDRPVLLDVAHEVLEPVATRFAMPRHAFFRVIHMLEAQHRFGTDPRRAGAQRFARSDTFAEALALRRIALRARRKPEHELLAWETLAGPAQEPHSGRGHSGAPSTDHGAPRRRRRGRRSRGRRGSDGREDASPETPSQAPEL
jgi:poly(A) polymerase